jgi:hypothetical protein
VVEPLPSRCKVQTLHGDGTFPLPLRISWSGLPAAFGKHAQERIKARGQAQGRNLSCQFSLSRVVLLLWCE